MICSHLHLQAQALAKLADRTNSSAPRTWYDKPVRGGRDVQFRDQSKQRGVFYRN